MASTNGGALPEPLDGHPLYAKVRTIGKGQRSFVQVARNKATGELVAIRFIPRGAHLLCASSLLRA
jgi:hypothetical protein